MYNYYKSLPGYLSLAANTSLAAGIVMLFFNWHVSIPLFAATVVLWFIARRAHKKRVIGSSAATYFDEAARALAKKYKSPERIAELKKKEFSDETIRRLQHMAKGPPPKISFPATPDSVMELVSWFVINDKWTKEMNTKSMFLLHSLVWPDSAKPQGRENTENVGNNPVLYLANVVMKDIEECAENKHRFRELIQKLFDLSGETLKESSRIALRYDIDTHRFDIGRTMEKIGDIKEQARFASGLYFDRIASARLRILGWIYHELYGEWFKDFVEKKSKK